MFVCLRVWPAAAAIDCRDGFQRVQGNLIATPFCQDALVGAVARQYGYRVSDREIRENVNLKRHLCRLIGRDIRIQPACLESGGRGRGY